MANVAAHIKTAREDGVEAGLEAYLESPMSRRHPNWAEIVGAGRRSNESMLKHYCRVFADAIGEQPRRIPAQQESFIGDVQGLAETIQAQVQAAILEALGQTTPVEDDDTYDSGEAVIEALMAEYEVSEAAARKMHERGIEPTEVTENVPATVVERSKDTARTKNAGKVLAGTITAGEAWEALGKGDQFKPGDPSKPANNGQLYRLNVSGLLAFRS